MTGNHGGNSERIKKGHSQCVIKILIHREMNFTGKI